MSYPEIPPMKIDRAIRVMEKQFADRSDNLDIKGPSADSPTEAIQLWASAGYSPNEGEPSSGSYWVDAAPSGEPSYAVWRSDPKRPLYEPGVAFPKWMISDESVQPKREVSTAGDPTSAMISRVKRRFRAAARAAAIGANQEQARRSESQLLQLMRESDPTVSEEGEARLALDVGYIAQRLRLVFTDRQARIWLESHNLTLGGRPLDVLRLRGTADIIAALDVEEQSAY